MPWLRKNRIDLATGSSVLLAALVGIVGNIVIDNVSWTVGCALAVLVVAQIGLEIARHRWDQVQADPSHPVRDAPSRPTVGHGASLTGSGTQTIVDGHLVQIVSGGGSALSLLVAAIVGAGLLYAGHWMNATPAGPASTSESAALTLTPARIEPGEDYTIVGTGFAANETVRLGWNGQGVIGDPVADGSGRVSARVREGLDAPPGNYVITGDGLRSGRHGSSTLAVLPPQIRVVGDKTGTWSAHKGGLTLTVTQVTRYSDGAVRVRFTVRNTNDTTAFLALNDLTASTTTESLQLNPGDAGTSWSGTVGGHAQTSGAAVFGQMLTPTPLKLSFPSAIMTARGFEELAVEAIPVS
jgi:hypothetical protein